MSAAMCPCCGQPVNAGISPEAAPPNAQKLKLTPQQRAVYNALIHAWPGSIKFEDAFDAIYPNAKRAPNTADNVIHIQLGALKKRLAPLGWTITSNSKGPRQWWSGYRLERLP